MATVTTIAYTTDAPREESFTDVELRFAEPSDVRLHGRQSTPVRVDAKSLASLVAVT